MVTDIKTIKKVKMKAKIKFYARVFMFLKNAFKKLVVVIRSKKIIRKIDIRMSEIIKTNRKMILNLKVMRNYNLGNNLRFNDSAHPLMRRIFASMVIICLISMQSLLISGFEAHVINVTAKIVNDIPDIEPNGGEFCNIQGATITLSATLTGTSTIIYTTDGSDPVCPATGNIYASPFNIFQSLTVKARTCHDGKQSAIASQYFDVSIEYCPVSNCNAKPISYWQNNEGCENNPALSNYAIQINNLSSGHFQSAYASTSAADICSALNINNCPQGGTIAGELCRAKAASLADLSNIVSGRLDLAAAVAGAFNNNQAFINLGLTASSTIEESLNKIEKVLVDSGATVADLANAQYVAERIYTFYNSENPYASGTCIYYEPGDIVLNEFVPNPSCAALPVDVALVMDVSGSMSYDSPTRISQAKNAANEFLGNLGSNDQSAMVSYSTTAALKKTLSNNHASTTAAINSLIAIGATDIGDGIMLANGELTSVRANPAAAKVEILLTDGMANKPFGPGYGEWPADVAYAKAKADEAKIKGIKIFTIGLGSSVNVPMLQYIAATTTAQYYFAPTGADLKAIYQQISQELCNNIGDDQTGIAGEWVEIYNKGTAQKDLANYIFANSSATTTVKINSGNTLSGLTTIGAPGSNLEWLVLLLNEARLNNNGDTIFLYDNANHLLDFYSYSSSIDNDPDSDPINTPGDENTLNGNLAGLEGKSFARIPDGTGEWIDPIPTPGAPNMLEENISLDITASSTENIIKNNEILSPATEQEIIGTNENIDDNNIGNQKENPNEPETASNNLDEQSAETGDSGASSPSAENIATTTEVSNNNSDDSDDNITEPIPAQAPEPSQNNNDDNNNPDPTDEQAKEPVKLIDTDTALNNQEEIL